VIGDESIIEIARRAPKTADELTAIRGVADKVGRGAQKGLVDAVAAGLAVSDDDLPSLEKRRRPAGDVDGAVDLMIALVRLRAREHGVAMPLMASRDDLERLAAGEREASPLLEGWRKKMVGEELLALIDGRLEMRVKDGALVVLPVRQSE
jgi:ribonuclease D